MLDGSLSGLIKKLQTIEWYLGDDEDKPWTIVEYEAYIHHHFQAFYDAETGVYDRMKDVQGMDVPRLVARVRTPEYRYSPYFSPELTSKLFECPGILLEYIEGGILLDDLIEYPERVPKEAWQCMMEDAVRKKCHCSVGSYYRQT